MTEEYLKKLKEKIANLSSVEKEDRDIYLSKFGHGEFLGPKVGYSSVDKPWLGMYPTVMLQAFQNRRRFNRVIDNLDAVWTNDDEMINYYDNLITKREIFENALAMAKAFKSYGMNEGDSILASLESVPEYIELFLAVEMIGCSIKNYIGSKEEIVGLINDDNSIKLYVAPDYITKDVTDKIYNETDIKNIITIDPLLSVKDKSKVRELIKEEIDSRYTGNESNDSRNVSLYDFYLIGKEIDNNFVVNGVHNVFSSFTSGSTGKPKEVLFTSEAVLGIIDQLSLSPSHDGERDKWLFAFLPPSIAAGVIATMLYPLASGKTLILDPYCRLENLDLEMMHYEPNGWALIPLFFNVLLESERIPADYDMSYFKLFGFGAEPMTINFINKVQSFLEQHNCNIPFSSGYGLSEGGSGLTVALGKEMLSSGTSGIPMINTTLGIFEPKTDIELGYNQIGEICKNGPGLMSGYSDKKLTDEALKVHSDGTLWLHTGDHGFMTEQGLLFVLGRSGIRVYPDKVVFPLSIENKLCRIEEVKDAIVVSGDDKNNEGYELPYLFIVPEKDVDQVELLSKINTVINEEFQQEEKPEKVFFIEKKPIDHFKTDRKVLKKEYKL